MGLDGTTAGVLILLAQSYLAQKQRDGPNVVRYIIYEEHIAMMATCPFSWDLLVLYSVLLYS